MSDAFYRLLASVGFYDPVHAALVHMPIGLVVGAFLFLLAALFFRGSGLIITSRHCAILALIFWFPVVGAGIMDWQNFYGGAWLLPIKVKIGCAAFLLVLLVAATFAGRDTERLSKTVLSLLLLAFLTVAALGYFGARLTLGGRTPQAPAKFSVGEWKFREHCSSCHPDGGNIIRTDMPLRGAPMLGDFTVFLSLIRNATPPMPDFDPSKITDEEAKELYDYITNTMR
jgi:hypothetical protein